MLQWIMGRPNLLKFESLQNLIVNLLNFAHVVVSLNAFHRTLICKITHRLNKTVQCFDRNSCSTQINGAYTNKNASCGVSMHGHVDQLITEVPVNS